MGIVYAAEDPVTGTPAAIKTVKSLSPKALSSLRSEVQTLRRIAHPGVVKVVNEGLSQGLPWYAMELLEGRTLHDYYEQRRSRLREGTTSEWSDRTTMSRQPGSRASRPGGLAIGTRVRPLDDELLEFEPSLIPLDLYRGICESLDYLHHLGLVHRDLKPSNVFLRDGRTPVLMDFGLASLSAGGIGRETLSPELGTRLSGTLPYLSPEQIRGELVDARADLYALGCMLYESIAGRPPFSGHNASAVVAAHLYDQPRRLSRFVRGMPPVLDDLVIRLLAKSPHERIGRADDVGAALASLGALSPFPSVPAPTGQGYLYRPRLSGRGAVLSTIDERREESAQGRVSMVLIRGESGVGKTFLAAESGQRAGIAGFRVLTGECQPPAGAASDADLGRAPLHPFRRVLEYVADRCREGGPETAARILGERAKILADYEPSLAFGPGQELYSDPPHVEPEIARGRVLAALRQTLLALSEETRLMLVIDDLQWADDLSLDLLTSIASHPRRGAHLLIVCTCRSDEIPSSLRRLLEAECVSTVDLERLDVATVGALVGDMLAIPSPPRDLCEFIAAQSEGNPFFAAEYLRLLVSENLLRRRGGKWQLSGDELGRAERGSLRLPIPGSIRNLAEQRAASLAPGAKMLLDAAVVLGREFDTDLLEALIGNQEQVFDALELLRRSQILESRGRGGLRFVHDAVREALYAIIPAPVRCTLHFKTAQLLELRHGWLPDAFELHPLIASHWSSAGHPARAARYLLRSAKHARAVYANAEAQRFYEAAIEHVNLARAEDRNADIGGDLLLRIHEDLGEVLILTGASERAEDVYKNAFELARGESPVRLARILRNIGKTRSLRHLHAEALDSFEQAELVLGDPSEAQTDGERVWRELVEIRNERVWAHYWTGDSIALTSLVQDLRPIVEKHGSSLQKANFYRALCLAELRRERFRTTPAALAYARGALAAASNSGDIAEIASTRFNLAFVLMAACELPEADLEMRQVIATAERLGDVSLLVRSTAYASVIARRERRTSDTWAFAAKARELAERVKMPHYRGIAEANVGWVEFRNGKENTARLALERALAIWRDALPVYPMQWLAVWPLVALDVEAGSLERAAERVANLLDLSQERLPDRLEDQVRRLATQGRVEDLTNAVTEARRCRFI